MTTCARKKIEAGVVGYLVMDRIDVLCSDKVSASSERELSHLQRAD
jgi:hypothetical protein